MCAKCDENEVFREREEMVRLEEKADVKKEEKVFFSPNIFSIHLQLLSVV